MARRIQPLGLTALILAGALVLLTLVQQLTLPFLYSVGALGMMPVTLAFGVVNAVVAIAALGVGLVAVLGPNRSPALGAVGITAGGMVLLAQLGSLAQSFLFQFL